MGRFQESDPSRSDPDDESAYGEEEIDDLVDEVDSSSLNNE